MNRKGFTLIELLMVIIIIAILSAILIPNVIAIINKNKQNSIDSLEKSIISAAKEYVSDNKYTMGFNCPSVTTREVNLRDLVNYGYLKSIPVNPITKERINEYYEVEIRINCDNKTFSYSFSFDQ